MSRSERQSPVARAERACAAREWEKAYELLEAADRAGGLPPEALERLAECARWTGRTAEVVDPLERAHAAHIALGDWRAAVRTALALSFAHRDAGNRAQAEVWWKRADERIAALPDCPELALLAWLECQNHGWDGNTAQQERCAARALELARRTDNRDVEALALVDLAHLAIARGEAAVPVESLDRAVSLALGGEIGMLAAGMVFCGSIWASRCRGDWQRAQEWTDSATRWVKRQQIEYFPGMCRVHRAEVLRIRGDLAAAERECEAATRQVARSLPAYEIFPWAELGEIRRRRGDAAGARRAFQRALELGWDPQPGLALLLLDEGDAAAALGAIERFFGEPRPSWQREDLANLLCARTAIALAAGDLQTARDAAAELAAMRDRNATAWDAANAGHALGLLALADGSAAAAVEHLRAARRAFAEVDAPYELARSAALLGRALAAQGDRGGARLELEAARDVFARIGAEGDRARVEAEIAALDGGATPAGSFDGASASGSGAAAPAATAAASAAAKSAAAAAAAAARGYLRREGEMWAVEYRGRAVRVRTSRGLDYLAALVAQPGTDLWAVDLAGAPAAGDAGEILDGSARAAYRRRAAEIAEELRDTDAHSNPRRAEELRGELESIGRELAAAVGLGGRPRRAGSGVERARQSVTKAIRSAIRRLAAADPELGRYFEVTIRTGTACRFAPELREHVEWRVERG